jgi:hypothetical protein
MKPTYQIMNTHYALSHVGSMRRRITRAPTWEDCADSYDAGLRHALSVDGRNRQKLLDYLQAMRIINNVHTERTP